MESGSRAAYYSSGHVYMREALISGLLFACSLTAANSPPPVTFSKDVLPVLQKSCQGCHRPGEAAPFSLLTYEESRPWAKAMKEAVLLRKMPPWFGSADWRVLERPLSFPEGHCHASGLVGPGCAAGRSQGRSGAAAVPGRLADSEAGRRNRDADRF